MRDTLRALVVGVGKNVAWIGLDGETEPRLAAIRRSSNKKDAARRSMPVPGDIAHVQMLADGSAVIEELEPRRVRLERRTVAGRSKVLAANVDTIAIVIALANPEPRLVTLDQLLAFAELETLGLLCETTTPIAAIIAFTKPDLADPLQRASLERLYSDLGYPVITLNPKTGENVETFIAAIAGRHALLCGNSGVGKSSIFRALGGKATVGETSRHGLGRQTTSTTHLYRRDGGFLIDSPGVSEFGLGKIAASELTQGFVEMRALAGKCRFTDCTHLKEPGCKIRAATDSGAIAASRYASYSKMLVEPT